MRSRSKYRNRRTNGYASMKEARRAQELKLLERAGEICDLKEQVRFELVPKQDGERAVAYIADFVYRDPKTGQQITEDVKGYRTDVYRLKKKLLLWRHGIRVVEI